MTSPKFPRYEFTSDNTAGACPEALEALIAANSGFLAGYGRDAVTAVAADAVRRLLDADADVRFVPSGTAANAIACATLCRPFEAVLAHRHAHICTHETGAPGFFGHGLGLSGLHGASGKIEPSGLALALDAPDDSHHQCPAALSLTNATEYGTVYRELELGALTALVKARGLPVHLDGARLANAVAAGFEAKSLKHLGIDILVLGGTKAGAPLSEAVVLFDKSVAHRFDARLKQAGQLASKGRMLSAPWIGLLQRQGSAESAWIARAAHANAMAQKLACAMPFKVLHPVEANGVFVEMSEEVLGRLRSAGWVVSRFTDGSVRFMCSWALTEDAVDEMAETLRAIQ